MTRNGLLEPSWLSWWREAGDGVTPVERVISGVRRQQGVHPRIGVDASAGAYFERHAPSGIGRVT